MNKPWLYLTPGIPDNLFIRGSVPMTKEEVRVITLAKARLAPAQVIWDIGSGTGSLAVEAARLCQSSVIHAVERDPDGIALIKQNACRFGLSNIRIEPGTAPEALRALPAPHRVFIGGSGGQLPAILEIVKSRLLPDGRLVLNAVTVETLAAVSRLIPPWQMEVVQVSVARGERAGHSHLLRAQNPVFIISAWKGDA